MVNIIVNRVTSLELILGVSTISKVDRLCLALLIKYHLTIGITHNGRVWTTHTRNFSLGIFRILIHALIPEAVNRSESTVQLDMSEIRPVLIIKLTIHVIEHCLIHLRDLILVVGECNIEVKRCRTNPQYLVTVDVKLPTHILHVTHILIRQGRKA